MSLIIFLNGCGSSGKTTIAHSIQHLSPKPWLRLGIDMFIDMMPPQYIAFNEKAKDGYFSFSSSSNDRGSSIKIETGPLGDRVFKTIPTVAKVLADQGNNLIIDEVLIDDSVLKTYISQLQDHIVYFLGVFCDLEKLQERELLRRDRAIGLANDQFDRVHSGVRAYDLKIDSSIDSPFISAKKILEFIEKEKMPSGFKKMESMLSKQF